MPEEARVIDRPGAEAFARHYFELINHANVTGDPKPMVAVAVDECANCASTAEQAVEFHSGGARFVGGTITTLSAVAATIEEDIVLVTMIIAQDKAQLVDRDGNVVKEFSSTEKRTVDFYAENVGGEWKTFGFALHMEGQS